jgi:hypothetical protein
MPCGQRAHNLMRYAPSDAAFVMRGARARRTRLAIPASHERVVAEQNLESRCTVADIGDTETRNSKVPNERDLRDWLPIRFVRP